MIVKLSDEELSELIVEVARKDAVPLVGLLRGKTNVSELKIAEKMRLTVNQVRSLLYSLSAHGLVFSIKRKDKKKGWYFYFWNLNEKNAFNLKQAVNIRKLTELKSQLKLEEKINYFVCPDECARVSSEDALENDFKCPDCGKLMVQESNIPRIVKLKEQIKNIEEALKKDKLELMKEQERLAKKSLKKVKKIVKKKPVKKKRR